MSAETLLRGYVLRVAVRRNRRHITLFDLSSKEVRTLCSFEALQRYLEREALRSEHPP